MRMPASVVPALGSRSWRLPGRVPRRLALLARMVRRSGAPLCSTSSTMREREKVMWAAAPS